MSGTDPVKERCYRESACSHSSVGCASRVFCISVGFPNSLLICVILKQAMLNMRRICLVETFIDFTEQNHKVQTSGW